MVKSQMKKQKKSTKKRKPVGNVRRRPPGKIDRKELSSMFLFTVVYFIFIIILNGFVETKLPGVQYIGDIPIKLSEGILYLGLAIWAMISTTMGANHLRD